MQTLYIQISNKNLPRLKQWGFQIVRRYTFGGAEITCQDAEGDLRRLMMAGIVSNGSILTKKKVA